MDTEKIHAAISKSLTYSDYEFQRKSHVLFKGKKLAENLELYLFSCPRCHSFCTMESKGNTFSCRLCNYTVLYGKDGHLTSADGACFPSPAEWSDWQRIQLDKFLSGYRMEKTSNPFWADKNVTLRRGGRMIPLKKISFGQIWLFSDRIGFINLRKQRTDFQISRIRGLNVQYNNQFEFYYNRLLYRFSFRSPKTSAYKWVLAIQLLLGKTGEESRLIDDRRHSWNPNSLTSGT